MKKLFSIVLILVSIIIPIFLVMSSARILFTPIFLDYEYNLPNFPADEYGFSTVDRLKWGKISLDYLLNAEGIDFLGNQKLDDSTPLYIERELSHMLDVKNLVQAALKVWYGIILLLALIIFIAWRKKLLPEFWRAVSLGGWLTIGLILVILAAVLINFNAFFAGFHSIFFTGDTWLFYESDSLIRLLPEKLWSDAFTFLGIFTLVWAVICVFFGARLAQKDQ